MYKLRTKSLFGGQFRIIILLSIICLLSVSFIACGNASLERKNEDGSDAGNSAPKMTDLERAIKSTEDAEFDYVYLVKRIDGGEFDDDDKAFLRTFVPIEVNRRIMTDEGKVFIAGLNFLLPEENLKMLNERFDVKDISPEKKEMEDDANNANQSENKEINNKPAKK